MIAEPMLTTDLENDPDTTPLGYAKVLRTLAGQLGPGNDYYVPLMDAAKILDGTSDLPSMNWKDGKPYTYCPECGRVEY